MKELTKPASQFYMQDHRPNLKNKVKAEKYCSLWKDRVDTFKS